MSNLSPKVYQPEELRFAYCYRIYLRWHSYKRRSRHGLLSLGLSDLRTRLKESDPHILGMRISPQDMLLLTSLHPRQSVTGAAGKLKGTISKAVGCSQDGEPIFGKGYFAMSTGKAQPAAVDRYLDAQEVHHNYSSRVNSPVHTSTLPISDADAGRLQPIHAHAHIDLHLVFGTWQRRGLFTTEEGACLETNWSKVCRDQRSCLRKITVLPDHVHLAVRLHPVVSPQDLVAKLLSAGEALMASEFSEVMIKTGAQQVWQNGAYIGSFGKVTSRNLMKYVQREP